MVGRRLFPEIVVPEEHYLLSQKIVARVLKSGETWSGQFPMKKRSGKVFTALVTKSLLFEDGELAGVIVVACDGEVVNGHRDERGDRAFELKNIKRNPRPPIAPDVIAASVSNLVIYDPCVYLIGVRCFCLKTNHELYEPLLSHENFQFQVLKIEIA